MNSIKNILPGFLLTTIIAIFSILCSRYVAIGSIAIAILIVVSIFRGTYLDISRDKLETKYAIGNSNFVVLDDGSRIHYRDEGNKSGLAIVLLHGFNGSLFNFELLVPKLAKDFRLISLDLPAFGLTGAIPSADYNTKNFIKTVFDLTKRKEIKIQNFKEKLSKMEYYKGCG